MIATRISMLVGAAVLAAGVLTACTSTGGGCSTGAATAADAVKGLVVATEKATKVEDVCQYTTPDSKYDLKDITALRSKFAGQDVSTLVYKSGDQMGSEAPVTVTSPDGSVTQSFYASTESTDQWTVYFGKSAIDK